MIDVHCHLNFHSYEKDVDEVIQKAHADGVTKIINVGTKLDSSQKAIELAEKYENLYAIVGVHPHHADKPVLSSKYQVLSKRGVVGEEGIPLTRTETKSKEHLWEGNGRQDPDGVRAWIKELEKLARHPKVVAIGEIGLDYYSYKSNGIVDPKLQKETFEAQIQMAHRLKLPLQIHNRHGGKDIIEILSHHKNLLQSIPGMFHCFAGDLDTLKAALKMGFYIGFDGNITYSGLAPGETVSLPELAMNTPLERIVTETDSPFLTPVPYRGSRNIPSHVILVGEFLAKIKGISYQEIDTITTENTKKLFGI